MKINLKTLFIVLIAIFCLTGCSHKFVLEPPEESTEKLYCAAVAGNEQALIEAVNEGADINQTKTEHLGTVSPLIISYQFSPSERFIRTILNYDIDPNFIDLSGSTIFYETIGIDRDNNFAFYTLLNKGADVNFIDKSGNNSIDEAIKADRYEYIDDLIEHGAIVSEKNIETVANQLNNNGKYLGLVKALDVLINNYQTESKDGNSNLYAAYTGTFTDDNSCENDAVLYGITAKCSKDVLEKYIDDYTDIDFLVRVAIISGNIENAKYLIDKGANIRFINDGKVYYNALRYAVDSGNYEMTEYIMNLNSEDIDECVYIAAQNNDLDMIRFLIENGANINNQKAFEESMHRGYNDIIEYFLENGFDINGRVSDVYDNYYTNVFMYCNLDIIKSVLNKSKILDENDLLLAVNNSVYQGNCELLYYLKELGADFTNYYTYEDGSGEAPLGDAISNGYYDITVFLVENGATLGDISEDVKERIINKAKLSDDIYYYLKDKGVLL